MSAPDTSLPATVARLASRGLVRIQSRKESAPCPLCDGMHDSYVYLDDRPDLDKGPWCTVCGARDGFI